jgi:cell wall-associated NlpC family hydrolase
MSTFEDILKKIKKKYQQGYGVAVFDIEAKNTKSGIAISGKVLTENQKNEVLEELKRNKDTRYKMQGHKTEESIKVLSDAEKRNEIGWAIVKNITIDLKSRFVSDKILNDKILNRIRCSQAFDGEILRVLYEHENQLLVQQSDLTLGWVDRSEIVMNKKSLYKEWRKGIYAIQGKIINFKKKLASNCHSEFISESIIGFKKDDAMQTDQKISKIKTKQHANRKKILKQVQDDKIWNKIIEEAKKYLGVKYVLGGKSENGIDCSGLVQVAYKNSLGVILPKYSWDQKEMGIKIKLKNVKTGDLIFLVKKENRHKHVGIAEVCENAKRLHSLEAETMEPAINLIHASLDKKKVVRQKLEEVFESHNFAEAKRIIE